MNTPAPSHKNIDLEPIRAEAERLTTALTDAYGPLTQNGVVMPHARVIKYAINQTVDGATDYNNPKANFMGISRKRLVSANDMGADFMKDLPDHENRDKLVADIKQFMDDVSTQIAPIKDYTAFSEQVSQRIAVEEERIRSLKNNYPKMTLTPEITVISDMLANTKGIVESAAKDVSNDTLKSTEASAQIISGLSPLYDTLEAMAKTSSGLTRTLAKEGSKLISEVIDVVDPTRSQSVQTSR